MRSAIFSCMWCLHTDKHMHYKHLISLKLTHYFKTFKIIDSNNSNQFTL